jgi:BirA family biotin operon repressor/biotin-[acetyl-CoA-carboxylase] ligase
MAAEKSPFALLRVLADGEFHSGEALAARFGLSRGAVWYRVRHIDALGLKVFKVRGRGYRLARPLDLLDAQALGSTLAQSAPRMSLQVLDECGSTNSELLARDDAPHGAVIACEHQRAGRGRRGNTWHSAVGASLAFSVKWRFSHGAAGLSGLSMAVSVAVVEALESLGCSGIHLKWPNDLLHKGQKLGGILIEVRADPQGPGLAVIGVGLNVDLPPEVKKGIDQPVTDIASLLPASLPPEARSRSAILAAVLSSLHAALERYEREGFAPFRGQWAERDAHRGRSVSLRVGEREIARGTAQGIGDDGALLLATPQGVQSFYSGEVSLR